MLTTLLTLTLLGTSAPAVTISDPAPRPNCNSAAQYHKLDFWIGDWDTFEPANPTGASIARTHVNPIAEGCAIHELYEQSDGLVGDSILSYDPGREQWHQTWVTNAGSIMMIYGNFKGDTLVLEGEVHLKSGSSVLQRISWKAQQEGVREWAEMSKDGGKTWKPAFDVLFRKHV
jgi:hypothetical protein